MRVLQLVDSLEYVRTNCYQHQLHEALAASCDLTTVPLGGITACDPDSYNVILSTLKLRTIVREVRWIGTWLKGRSITIYDQDPWEAFIDVGSLRGAYQMLQERLNVQRFLNTSQGWVNRINETLGPDRSRFVRMWVLPKYCDEGVPWDQRPIDVGFMGTLHPYRKKLIDELSSLGIRTHVELPGPYETWLAFLSKTRFFIHAEADDCWSIDGRPITGDLPWIKDVEVMARGCLPIRRWDPGLTSYDLHVGVIPYHHVSDVSGFIKIARSDGNASSKASVEFVRSVPAWGDLVRELEYSAGLGGRIGAGHVVW